MNTENEIKKIFTQRILSSLKELLETKHLYQHVVVRSDDFEGIIQKSIDEYLKHDESRQTEPTARGGTSYRTENAPVIKELLQKKLFLLLNSGWDFLPEMHSYPGAEPILLHGQGMSALQLASIRVSCGSGQCKATIQPHNSGYPSFQEGISSGRLVSNGPTIQTFTIPYLCQNCKERPLIFLVKREGLKLTLVGRSEFPEIYVPDYIPKEQRRFYRNAIISVQANFALAAILYLRTLVEQHFYQSIPESELAATRGNPTGDELADLYAKTLPENFPNNFPSLKKAYNDLSEVLHQGDEDDGVTAKFLGIKSDIEKHFDALRVFNSILIR